MELNHRIIPVRNIDLKFNSCDASHYLEINSARKVLEDVYFSGLQDQFKNANIVLKGKVHVIGICFYPEGVFPFFKILVSEFKNQLLGANVVRFHMVRTISEKLKEATDITTRLSILESELLSVLDHKIQTPEDF